MQIFLATIFSIAILLDNSVKLRAAINGPVPAEGDAPSGPECQMCCQGPAAVPGIPGLPGQPGPYGQVGSKGDSGEKGEKGDTGPNGPAGEPGAPGNPGSKGDNGLGLPGKMGPRGPQGLVGPTGETDIKGQKGEAGETPDSSSQRAFTVRRRTSTARSPSHDTRLPFEETVTLLPGTSFDLETCTFTCNITGTYVFMFSANTYPNEYLYVHLRKNDNIVVTGHSSRSNEHKNVSGSVVLVLQQGDLVYLTMAGRVYSDSYYRASFSGFLLYTE